MAEEKLIAKRADRSVFVRYNPVAPYFHFYSLTVMMRETTVGIIQFYRMVPDSPFVQAFPLLTSSMPYESLFGVFLLSPPSHYIHPSSYGAYLNTRLNPP
jgi:hypothetical protein